MRNLNSLYNTRQQIAFEIRKIPKKNRKKFFVDYLKLIQLAQKDNYENYEI